MEQEQTHIEQFSRASENLYKVTPLSKYLTMALFVALPFIGGWVGYSFTLKKVTEVEQDIEAAEKNENTNTMSKAGTVTILGYEYVGEPEYRHEEDYQLIKLTLETESDTGETDKLVELVLLGYNADEHKHRDLVDADLFTTIATALEKNGIDMGNKTIEPFSFGIVSSPSYGDSIADAGIDYRSSGAGLLVPDMVEEKRDDGKTSQFFSNSPLYFKLYSPHKVEGIFAYYPYDQTVTWLTNINAHYNPFAEHLFWGDGHLLIQNNGSSIVLFSMYADKVLIVAEPEDGISFASNCMYGCQGDMSLVTSDPTRTNEEVLRYAMYRFSQDDKADDPSDEPLRDTAGYREINLLDFIESQGSSTNDE